MTPAAVYRDPNGHAILLVREGRTKIHAIMIRPPVAIVKFEKGERRYWRPLEYKGKPYPVARALRRFREAGRDLGITKSARTVLRELRESA